MLGYNSGKLRHNDFPQTRVKIDRIKKKEKKEKEFAQRISIGKKEYILRGKKF